MFWLLLKLTAAGRLFVESRALHEKLSAIFPGPKPFPEKVKDMADTIMNSAFQTGCDSCATRRCRNVPSVGGQLRICKANAKVNGTCALECCGFQTFVSFAGRECLDLSTLRPNTVDPSTGSVVTSVGLSGGGMAANVLKSFRKKRAVQYVIPNHGPEGKPCGVNSEALTHHMNTKTRTYEGLTSPPDVLILGVGPMPKPGPANPDQNLRSDASVAHIAKIHNPYGSAVEGGDLYGPNEGDGCYSMSIDKMRLSNVIFVIGQSTGNDGPGDKGQLEPAKIRTYARDGYPLYVLLEKALADRRGPDVVWIGHYSAGSAFLEEAEVTADRSLVEVEVTADGSVKHVSARRLVVREDDSARNEGS